MSPPAPEPGSVVARKGSFSRTLRAVVWSFLGIRKSSDLEKDVNQLNPVHVVVVGLLTAAAFVVGLVVLVKWVVGSGVAS